MSPLRRRGGPRVRRRLPHGALLVLSSALAGVVIYLTWPARAAIFCEQLPELTALALCAAVLLVFAFRAMAAARIHPPALEPNSGPQSAPGNDLRRDLRIPGGSAILAGLALFLAAHYVAQYRRPCVEVQQQLRQGQGPVQP